MQYLLHIDTSAENGLVAVTGNGAPISVRTITDSRNQAATINILIDEVLAEAGIGIVQLSAVAVCAGPGSYTGLRIGMATAKALCYVADIPLLAHNKLTLLTYQVQQMHPAHSYYMAALEARENEYFVAAYDGDMNELQGPAHFFADDLQKILNEKKNLLIIGDIDAQKYDFLLQNEPHIVADTILDINAWGPYAYEAFKCNRTVNLALAEPFYLKQVYTHNSKKDS
jgi:tRNA threonylcarbamoyladenosine biosynthesis protein TsaB